jgi:hypothetical protein
MHTLQETLGALVLIALFIACRPMLGERAAAERKLVPAQTRGRLFR